MLFIRHKKQPIKQIIRHQSEHCTDHAKAIPAKFLSLIRSALIFFSALFLCSPAAAETLIIPGSGNPEYILGVLAGEFNKQQSMHTVVIPTTIGSAGAFREITEGHASLGRIGRPLSETERQQGFIFHSLGRDPIVFVGGAGVSVRNISPKQVLDIFSGRLTNWQELGGKPATIRAIGRENTDASYRAIARGMEGFNGIKYADSVKLAHLDSQLLELLDRFSASFGFLNRSALFAAKTKLTQLTLNTIEANAENLKTGHYPLWTEIGLIYKKKELTEAGHAFLNFLSSPEGLKALESHGLLAP